MKWRATPQTRAEPDEAAEVARVRHLEALDRAVGSGAEGPPPSGAYWQNLVVRTNARIDQATSAKALTISWAARVAVPGVIALVSFLVALSYFGPERKRQGASAGWAVEGLSVVEVDSLYAEAAAGLDTPEATEAVGQLFVVSREDVAAYFADEGGALAALETLDEEQLGRVLGEIGTTRD